MPLGMTLKVMAGLGLGMLVFSWNNNFWTTCQEFTALFTWGYCSVIACLTGLPGAQVQFFCLSEATVVISGVVSS